MIGWLRRLWDAFWVVASCLHGHHVVWLGDLRKIPGADHVVPERNNGPPREPVRRVDSPCLECGKLLEAEYGHAFHYQRRLRVLWTLADYMPEDVAHAYAMAVALCNRSGDETIPIRYRLEDSTT